MPTARWRRVRYAAARFQQVGGAILLGGFAAYIFCGTGTQDDGSSQSADAVPDDDACDTQDDGSLQTADATADDDSSPTEDYDYVVPVVIPVSKPQGQKSPVANTFVWSQTYVSVIRNYSASMPGLVNVTLDDNSGADEYFGLFWTDEVWQTLVDMTNRRAQQLSVANPRSYYVRSWKQVTIEEMKAFFGVRLSMEYAVIRQRYESYWMKKKQSFLFHTPGYRQVFTRDRWLAIWKCLHFVDEENCDKTDKLYKVRDLVNYIVGKFRAHYIMDRDLSLDEGVIPSKNRLSFKQYLKDKPTKWGLKTFMVCESNTGYIFNIEIYVGRSTADTVPELGATVNVVIRMLSGLENKGHIVYMDRFYTSPRLYKYLSDRGFDACGTALTNRKQFPQVIIGNKKNLQRGDSVYVCSENISAVMWMDRRPIYFMSTCHDPQQKATVSRRDKQGHAEQVACPVLAQQYNLNMGGCDKNDQVAKLHKSRKHYRWPRRVFMKCVMWSAYNAFVIEGYKRPHVSTGKHRRLFVDFLDDLVMKLIGTYRQNYHPRQHIVPNDELRLKDVGKHFPQRPAEARGNNTCVVCREKHNRFRKANPAVPQKDNPEHLGKTVFQCSECKDYLCIKPNSSCWADYHTKRQFWR